MVFEPTVRHRRSRLSAARAACFEELAGVLASSGALHYAKIFTSLNRKYFCYQHKAVSDKKSGNSLMDGAEKLPASRIHTGLQSFPHPLLRLQQVQHWMFEL